MDRNFDPFANVPEAKGFAKDPDPTVYIPETRPVCTAVPTQAAQESCDRFSELEALIPTADDYYVDHDPTVYIP